MEAPERGDICFVASNPMGTGSKAHKPVLVVSPGEFNQAFGLMLCCPIGEDAQGIGFEVQLKGLAKTPGVVFCNCPKTVDFSARDFYVVEKAPFEVVSEVLAKLRVLLD